MNPLAFIPSTKYESTCVITRTIIFYMLPPPLPILYMCVQFAMNRAQGSAEKWVMT